MSPIDTFLAAADGALRTLSGAAHAARPYPAEGDDPPVLDEADRRLSGALMRVNHVGEVCAQALYSAQGLTATNPALREHFANAAREEVDHLAWTRRRLGELGARPSLLDPLWFAGAFGLGLIAGRAGEPISLGFVAETERQVARHLESHLGRLPAADSASRDVVQAMREDESGHARKAEAAGAAALPLPIRGAMRLAAKIMTTTAHFL